MQNILQSRVMREREVKVIEKRQENLLGEIEEIQKVVEPKKEEGSKVVKWLLIGIGTLMDFMRQKM